MRDIIKRILREEIEKSFILESKTSNRRGLLTESNETVGELDFNTIYNNLWDKMLNTVCMSYTKDRNKAADYCQEGFMKVLKNLHKYNQTGSLEGWVRRIIKNNIIDELRKEKKMKHHSSEEPDWGRIEMDDEPYEETYSVDMIEDVIDRLSPAYRRVFELFYFQHMSHEEIAKKLGISVGTSKSNLAKAKMNVKKFLNL
jgi:RNA polymerase sigma-70 factor (ECF subfamily)